FGTEANMRRIGCIAGGLAALAFAKSALASDYSNAVLALNPNEYLQLNDTSGIGIDSAGGGLHPLRNIEAGVLRGVPGSGSTDGYAGFGSGNLAYGFPSNIPNGDSVGAQTSTFDLSQPQPGDGYIPATGKSARTVISWFRLIQRPGIEGDPNNDPNGR